MVCDKLLGFRKRLKGRSRPISITTSKCPEGVKAGKIDLHTLVNAASTQVAKTFDLFPKKGTIQVGGDADLVVFDPGYRGVISAKTQSMNVDYSAFEGWPMQGRVETVTVRGKIQVKGSRFVGTNDHGRMLKREATHGD